MNTTSEQSATPAIDELAQLDPADRAGLMRLIGRRLAAGRETAGLGLDEVGARLKLPAARFAALETGDWERLPDANFARALARSYAKLLQISIDDALARLHPPAAKPAAPVARELGERYKPSYPSFRLVSRLARPLLGAAAALAALVVIGGGWYVYRDVNEVEPKPELASAPPVVAAPSAASYAEVLAVAASAVNASSAEAASAAAASATIELQLTGSTWIQLSDATGQKLLNKQTAGAVSVPLTGQAPWQLVIGDIATVGQIRWRGKPLELAPYAGAKLARITLQ